MPCHAGSAGMHSTNLWSLGGRGPAIVRRLQRISAKPPDVSVPQTPLDTAVNTCRTGNPKPPPLSPSTMPWVRYSGIGPKRSAARGCLLSGTRLAFAPPHTALHSSEAGAGGAHVRIMRSATFMVTSDRPPTTAAAPTAVRCAAFRAVLMRAWHGTPLLSPLE